LENRNTPRIDNSIGINFRIILEARKHFCPHCHSHRSRVEAANLFFKLWSKAADSSSRDTGKHRGCRATFKTIAANKLCLFRFCVEVAEPWNKDARGFTIFIDSVPSSEDGKET